MKNACARWSILLLTVLALAACGGSAVNPSPMPPTGRPPTATALPTTLPTEAPPPTATPIVISDGAGHELSLSGPAQRIVSLAPSNTEFLFAVGAGDQVVGRDDFSDYPDEALAVDSIGSTYGELNVEAIVGLEPDLVLAADITPPEQVQSLEDVGLPVFIVTNPKDFSDLFDRVRLIGVMTGHSDQAGALAADMEDRYQAVTSAVAGAEPVSLFYEVDGSDPNAPWTTGSGTFQTLMFELAGGQNIADEMDGWGQLSLEKIVVSDPQVIIYGGGPFVPTTVESLKARAGWGAISAVKNDRVHEVDTDLIDLPGPRLVEGLERVAQILHPERFDQ
jgi:iron complex transport system substrate-binding protein